MITTTQSRHQFLPLYAEKSSIVFFKGDLRKTCLRGDGLILVNGSVSITLHEINGDIIPISNVDYSYETYDSVAVTVAKVNNDIPKYLYWEFSDVGETWYSEVFYGSSEGCITLTWENVCNDRLGYYGGDFINKWGFNVFEEFVRRHEKKVSILNNLGIKTVTNRIAIKDYVIKTLIPTYALDAFQSMKSHDTIKVIQKGIENVLYDVRMDVVEEGSIASEVEIIYKIKDEDIIFSQCHKSIYATDGTDDGYGGYRSPSDSPPPTVVITESEGVLTAVASGGVITWTLNGSYIATGSTVTMSGSGVYTATTTENGQTGSDSHTLLDKCGNISVTVSKSGNVLSAISKGFDTETYAWEYSMNGTTYSTIGSNISTHAAQNVGYYKSIVTDTNGCTKPTISYVAEIINTGSAHTVEITRVGNTLTNTITGCTGVDTYKWYKDTGSGKVLIVGEESQTLEVTTNGTYFGVGLCDGAEAENYNTVLNLGEGSDYSPKGQNQVWFAEQGQTQFVITDVDMPNPNTTAAELDDRYTVEINATRRLASDLAPTIQYEYQLTFTIEGAILNVLALDVYDRVILMKIND